MTNIKKAPTTPTALPPIGKLGIGAVNDKYGLQAWAAAPVMNAWSLFPNAKTTGAPATGDEAMDAFVTAGQSKAPEDQAAVTQIQMELYQAGLYPKKYQPVWGHVRPEDRDAFRNIVKLSAQSKADLPTYLSTLASAGAQAGLQGTGALYETQTHTVSLTSPDVISSVADAAYEQARGRRATADEKASLLAKVNGQERSNYAAEYGMEDANRRAYLDQVSGKGVALPSSPDAPSAGSPSEFRTAEGNQGDIDNFMHALSNQESGNPNAVNKDSGAKGTYQILPQNWSSWAQEAGLAGNAPMTAENQEIVARYKVGAYFKRFGNWQDVAIAWYGGPGAVAYSEAAKNAPQGRYPSINQYASSVLGKMGRANVPAQAPVLGTPVSSSVDVTQVNPSDVARTAAEQGPEFKAHEFSTLYDSFKQMAGA